QWRRWSEDVIPSMKSFYLTYLRKSLFLRHEVQLPLPLCESGCDLRRIVVCCVGMNGIHSLELDMCHCCPAAQQLLARRFFPCAPIAPSLAVSLPLLALVHEIFVRMPPNMSAWCEAYEAALHSRGHTIVAKVSFYCSIPVYLFIIYRKASGGVQCSLPLVCGAGTCS
ncbi:hypothetical protein BU15DRAFT_57536, partial [Melanogaster broomeanus]